jgi:hypothetical protein
MAKQVTMNDWADYIEDWMKAHPDVKNVGQEPEMGEVYIWVTLKDGRSFRVIVECPE